MLPYEEKIEYIGIPLPLNLNLGKRFGMHIDSH